MVTRQIDDGIRRAATEKIWEWKNERTHNVQLFRAVFFLRFAVSLRFLRGRFFPPSPSMAMCRIVCYALLVPWMYTRKCGCVYSTLCANVLCFFSRFHFIQCGGVCALLAGCYLSLRVLFLIFSVVQKCDRLRNWVIANAIFSHSANQSVDYRHVVIRYTIRIIVFGGQMDANSMESNSKLIFCLKVIQNQRQQDMAKCVGEERSMRIQISTHNVHSNV